MEEERLKNLEIEQLDIMELEEIVKNSPWFSYARHLLLIKLHSMGDEIFSTHLKKSAIFLSSRKSLYDRVSGFKQDKKNVGKVSLVESSEDNPKRKPKVIVAGADFFSKDEFNAIPEQDNMEIKLRSSKFYRDTPELSQNTIVGPDGKVNYDDLAFFTETLGHIYAQQGYYDQAIEVFSKLILLYPQKSAYFATLIRETEKNKDL